MNAFGRKLRRGRRFQEARKGHHYSCPPCSLVACTLADVPTGCQARVTSFANHLNSGRSAQLNAYGLAPGRCVRVVQRSPVIVVQVDQSEIALEHELARGVNVEEVGHHMRQD